MVTGSSSGIGREIALELARGGANVFVHARSNLAGATETATAIGSLGGQAAVSLIDLSDPVGQDEFCEQAWNWRNGVDIWINNAGADVLTGEPAAWSFEHKLEQLLRIDVVGTIRISRAIGRKMVERFQNEHRNHQQDSVIEPGTIINVGWDQAEVGMAGDSGELFATSKGAVMAFTRSLAKSLAPSVRVNCVAPGWIRTSWAEQASSYWQQRAQSESLLQRWGSPQDVAHAVRFLASPSAAFITGQIWPINGGFRSK